MDELERFTQWCNTKAFLIYEATETDGTIPEIWVQMPNGITDFEVVTVLGTQIKITGAMGIRKYELKNLKYGAHRTS